VETCDICDSSPASATADDGGGALGRRRGHGERHRARTGVERRFLEHTHRAVPQHRSRARHQGAIRVGTRGADVEHGLPGGNRLTRDVRSRMAGVHGRRDGRVYRQHQLVTSAREQIARHVETIRFHQRIAGLEAHGLEERASHRTTDEQLVHLRQQRFHHVDLAADLRAAKNGHERTFRIGERAAQIGQFLLHQETRHRRTAVARHTGRARVGTMGRAERVVDVHITKFGKLPRERVVVLLLTREKARVLEQQHFTGLQRLCGRHRSLAHGFSEEVHRTRQHLTQPCRHRSQRVLRLRRALGTPEVRQQHHARSTIEQLRDGRQRRRDACVVAHTPLIIERHVEVDTHEGALALQLGGREIANGLGDAGHRISCNRA
jgi:hypothetical protein